MLKTCAKMGRTARRIGRLKGNCSIVDPNYAGLNSKHPPPTLCRTHTDGQGFATESSVRMRELEPKRRKLRNSISFISSSLLPFFKMSCALMGSI